MPYPWYKSFLRWEECPRCGFLWPKRSLHRDFTGAKVCPSCWDEEGFEEHRRNVHLRIEELDTDERIEPIL